MKMFGRELTSNELKTFVVSYSDKDEIRMPSAWAIELIGYKEQNNELENANRIVQAELKRQYERVDALTAENKLLSDRVKELNNITDSFKKQLEIKSSKLSELRKAYFELKSDRETVHVTVRCDKCK